MILKIVSEYDHEILQSQIADKPMVSLLCMTRSSYISCNKAMYMYMCMRHTHLLLDI